MPSNKTKLCNFRLKVTVDELTKQWWLMSDSVIGHNDHPILCTEAKHAGESDLTPDQMEFIQHLYSHGVILSTMSDNMRKIIGKEFNSTMMSNVERKVERGVDEAYGINPK